MNMYNKMIANKIAKVVKDRGIRVDANIISDVHMTISDLVPLCYTNENMNMIVDYVVALVEM